MTERKPFLLRLDPAVFEALQRWAGDELRSLNAQIETLLRGLSGGQAIRFPITATRGGRASAAAMRSAARRPQPHGRGHPRRRSTPASRPGWRSAPGRLQPVRSPSLLPAAPQPAVPKPAPPQAAEPRPAAARPSQGIPADNWDAMED
jgi:hypothetical protein